MASQPIQISWSPVQNDQTSLTTASHTLMAAFKNDPVVRWLRPTCSVSDNTNAEAIQFSTRRIQAHGINGVVLRSQSISEVLHQMDVSPTQESKSLETAGLSKEEEKTVPAALVLLVPPKIQQPWISLSGLWTMCKLLFCQWWDPVDTRIPDRRMQTLLQSQKNGLEWLLRREPTAWHLESIAVHPSLQGRGVGKKAIEAILEYTGQSPIAIECSNEKNLGFYKYLGFEIVEEVELVDESRGDGNSGRVREWVMLRR